MKKLLRAVLACVLLAALPSLVPAQADKPPEWTPEEKELTDKATKLDVEAAQLYGAGKRQEALNKLAEALDIRRKLYPPERFKDGHPDLASSLNYMGSVLRSLGESGKALSYYEQALAMRQKLYPPERFKDGHPDLASSLNNVGVVLGSLGEHKKSLTYLEQALAMRQKLYPPERFKDGHHDLAGSLNNMGFVLDSLGESGKALTYYEQALVMLQKLYPKERFKDGHPDLAATLGNIGRLLDSLGESEKALTYSEQALVMNQNLYPKERFKDGHPDLARSLNNMGAVLDSLGQPGKALTYYEQGLTMRQQLYPKERFPNGHPDVATSLGNMGIVLQALGKSDKALAYHEQALAMRQQLYPKERFPNGHSDVALSLNNMGFVLSSLGEPDKALAYYAQALAMYQQLYPKERFKDGHAQLADSLSNMGAVLDSLSEPGKALSYFEQALAMRQQLYPKERFPNGHPDVALSLNNMGAALKALGEPGKALTYYEQSLAMYQKLYPKERFKDGHPTLAQSLSNMGEVMGSLGESGKALTYFEQALAMRQQLYPKERFKDGHPDVAQSLHNMGFGLESLGEFAKALAYYEQAFGMYQQLYPKERFPNGHPELATSLNNMGAVLRSLGEPGKALAYYEQALAMEQNLYPKERFPNGHPHLSGSLGNMADVLRALGKSGKALAYYEQALAMEQNLYPKERFPDGHPDLARRLTNIGFGLESLGEPGKALPYFEQALIMNRKLGMREAGQSSEAQALAYRQQQPRTRDGYLSVAVQSSSVPSYRVLWSSRGDILPLLQARHQSIAALTRQPGMVKQDYDELVLVRQKISRLQSDFPKDAAALKRRDEELANLTDKQDRLERKLASSLPEFKHLKGMAEKSPADLAKQLPKSAAFVDVIRYNHGEKGTFVEQRYVALVVLPGKNAKFLQLGDAKPIDEAVASWRRSIDRLENSLAPAKLRELVWDKIAQELPPETKIVYFCPDGDLARMPFAALPGAKKGTILLEDHALAVVPSGQWLLQQLLYPPKPSDAPDHVLAVGDIAYGKGGNPSRTDYKALPATGREIKRVLEAFGQETSDSLTGDAGNSRAVRDRITNVRYAHFATHGYFDEKNLTAERQRLKKYLEDWKFQLQAEHRQSVPLVRNEAGYVGLVFAGANAPDKAGPDRGILNGLNFVDLPLENLRLCVLSACETGLGELTEAEGVLGLQRSFHAAGCPNVIGSLWTVNDEATAALMTQFYHELRKNKRSPVEALREAQLTLYRHPELIPKLAEGTRGKINPGDPVTIGSKPPEVKPGETAKTTPTKLWAAFVLSGRGE
jgi:tetratricopeptide (TPR) repeat protein